MPLASLKKTKSALKLTLGLLTVGLLIAAFYLIMTPMAYIEFAETRLKLDIADTPAAQSRGLSGRDSLGEDDGMLFVFEQPGLYGFWMKDMNFAIDIIWLDENFKVVDISHQLSPDTYPQTFTSKVPAKYVLEVNAGFKAAHDIKIGDQARSSLGRR